MVHNSAAWEQHLHSAPLGVALPLSRRSDRGRRSRVPVTATAPDGLDERLDLLAGALTVLLHRYTAQQDVVIGCSTDAGATVFPLRISVSTERTLTGMLTSVRAARTTALTLGALPAGELADVRGIEDGLPCQGIVVIGDPGDAPPIADLTVIVTDDISLEGSLAPEALTAYARHLGNVISGLNGGDGTVGTLPLFDEAENHKVIAEWNATDQPVPPLFFHEEITEIAENRPDAVAVVHGEERLTFGELDGLANRMANHLRDLGVARESRVGVCFERGTSGLIAQLAAFKLGATAVLVDPEYPQERIEFMLADADVAAVVTRSGLRQLVAGPHATVLADVDDWRLKPDVAIWTTLSGDSVCHIAYTSGSTGKPKAVTLRHGPMRSLIHTLRQQCAITAESSGTWLSSPGFGLVEVDCFPVLAAGGTVHIPADDAIVASPERLRDWLVEQRVTHSLLLTAMAERLWTLDWPSGTALRSVRIAGERVRSWPRAGLPFEVLNVYGSAEVAVVTTANLTTLAAGLSEEDLTELMPPVGRPTPNVRAYVLDPLHQPVPAGVLGELYISGTNLSANYLNRPDTTAAKFLPNTVPGDPHPVLYRSGDVARYWPDGTIEVVGRTDNEVKVRGYRVHLGEIESLIADQPGVRQTAVLAKPDENGETRLVAYVEADRLTPVRLRDVRRVLRRKLPPYMLPAAYVLCDLGTTANGKVDRDALPEPESARPDLDTPFQAPRDDLERLLAEIWSDVLGVDEIGVLDDFFELGGDSMRAVRVIDGLRENGYELGMADLLTASSVAQLARVVERVHRESTSVAETYPVLEHDSAGRFEPYPLNHSQQALWIGRGDAVEYGNVGCHGYFEYEHPSLDVERFRQAWQKLLRRHDMLRMVVKPDGTQVVLEETPGDGLTIADLSGLSFEDAEREVTAIREHMSHQVIPNDRWPLYDVRLTRLPGGHTRLHFGLDMLITDAWSIYQVLFPDLIDLYDDLDADLPELRITFRDYVLGKIEAQRSSAEYVRAKSYWLNRLPTLPAAPDLPTVANPAEQPMFHRREHSVPAERWQDLKEQGNRLGLTPSVLLVAVFAEVLRTWSANDRFTVNFPVSDRMHLHPQVDALIGDFTNTLLVAIEKVDGTFEERARDIQEQLWRDLAHRAFNGVDVLREIARREGGTLRPVMPVVVTSLLGQPARRQSSAFGEETYGISQTPQVTLDFQIREIDGVLHFKWDFLHSLFPDGMIDAMFSAFVTLLDRLCDDSTAWREDRFELVPADQLALRAIVNSTDTDVPSVLLQELLAARAYERPDAPAVITPCRTLSYATLVRESRQIGNRLRALGARPNSLVAIVMEKGWEQYTAVYGVVTAGAAYLPIDAGVPAERLTHLLRDGEVEFVLTQPSLVSSLPWPSGVRVMVVGEDFADAPDTPLAPVQSPTDLAYVIYTSGSTGRPKGVMVDHRGVVNHVLEINRRLDIGPDDRAMGTAGLHFDMSVYDVFGILAAGGTVVLPAPYKEPDPAAWVSQACAEGVTFWGAVPALMDIVVDHVSSTGGCVSTLRRVVLAGDWIPLSLPDRLRLVAPSVEVISSGGPTETVNWSIIYPIGEVDPEWASIPYGTPLANHRYHILDEQLAHRPVWTPGQMFVSSAVGLAHGYWRDPERTAEQFFHLPSGERVYATGDLGRYRPDGTIEILGRTDFQVKINGYRVELGEIEAALTQHPSVASATLVAPHAAHGGRRLVAFVVPSGDLSDVTEFLRDRLPGYLIPADIRSVEEFPLTANGKVDRLGLAASIDPADEVVESSDGSDATVTPLEQVVAELYAVVLELESVGVNSDFFRLGGDSLTGTRLAGRLSEALGVEVPLRAVLTRTTARSLAAAIAADETIGAEAVAVAEMLAGLSEEDLVALAG